MGDFFLIAGIGLILCGSILAAFKAFEESRSWGWWCTIFPPANFLFSYFYRVIDFRPFFFHAAGVTVMVIYYVINAVNPFAAVTS